MGNNKYSVIVYILWINIYSVVTRWPLFTVCWLLTAHTHTCTHTHNRFTALFDFCPGLPGWAGTRKVNQSEFTGARDSEWQWHQLDHMQICTLTQTHNHASIPPLSFLQAGCPSCRPANSVKALNANINSTHTHTHTTILQLCIICLGFPSVLWRCWLGVRKGIRPVKNWVVGCWRGCLGWGADGLRGIGSPNA